jgi:hypothetical protein
MGVARICWWGCESCGQKVSNDHMGPCLACGGRIRRFMPTAMIVEADSSAARPSIKPGTQDLSLLDWPEPR